MEGMEAFGRQLRDEAVRLEGVMEGAPLSGMAEVRAVGDLAGAMKELAKAPGPVTAAAEKLKPIMSDQLVETIIRKRDGLEIVCDLLGIDPEAVVPGTEEAKMVGADDQPAGSETLVSDSEPTDQPGDSTEGGEGGDESQGEGAGESAGGDAAPEAEIVPER